jgi:glycine/D-amino acid oxidase-like deaminating enzyme
VTVERADVAVIGSGFGGAVAAFRYAAAGLRVVVLERGARIADPDLRQSQAPDDLFRVYTRYQSTFVGGAGDTGLDVLTGTVVGGGSIVYSGASLRAPSFVFRRVGADGRSLWPAAITRAALDPYYETVESNLPVTQLVWHHDDPAQAWRQVPRRGSAWAQVMAAAGHTVLPLRQAVHGCVHCGWCNAGCRFGAKRDLTKSYPPAAERLGAVVRPGVEVTLLTRTHDRWQVLGVTRRGPGPLDVGPEGVVVEADQVVVSCGTVATTLLLQRSGVANAHLGKHISLAPYHDPPFTCTVIDYGTAAPTLPAPAADPLCVRYDKTNITVSTLGVVDFLAAEPGRFAIVAGKCSYWQQDHWAVRVTPGTTPIVEWEGSYWYDGRTGSAGGIFGDFRVDGHPADGRAFADALRPLVGNAVADELQAYAADGGGGGANFTLPVGFGSTACPPSAAPSPRPRPDSPSPQATADASARPPAPAQVHGSRALATTGTSSPVLAGLAAMVGGLAMRRFAHHRR